MLGGGGLVLPPNNIIKPADLMPPHSINHFSTEGGLSKKLRLIRPTGLKIYTFYQKNLWKAKFSGMAKHMYMVAVNVEPVHQLILIFAEKRIR